MSRTAFASVLLLSLFITRPASADTPVHVVANLGFRSAFWINLHHTLYAAAWARRPDTGTRRLIGPMPAPLVAPLSDAERAAWDAAVDYYDRNDYTPYTYATGLFDWAWSQYHRPIEEQWEPYVRGEITRAQAIERTVAAIVVR